jgi:chromosomal replication initiation ATPase DnaA
MLTIETILASVAQAFDVAPAALTGRDRSVRVSRARAAAVAAITALRPDYSLCEIGVVFDGRDHTTIIAARRRAAWLQATDRAFAAALQTVIGGEGPAPITVAVVLAAPGADFWARWVGVSREVWPC